MWSIDKIYWEPFEYKFLKLQMQEFQDWVAEILDLAYPGDFTATGLGTPDGGGDWGSDGYRVSTAAVYQIYAPPELTTQKLREKIKRDFARALEKLRPNMKRWIFVCKTDTFPVTIQQLLGKLQADNPDVTISFLKKNELWDIVRNLEESGLRRLFANVRGDLGQTDQSSENPNGRTRERSRAAESAGDLTQDNSIGAPETPIVPTKAGDRPPKSEHWYRLRKAILICLCIVAITVGPVALVNHSRIEPETSILRGDSPAVKMSTPRQEVAGPSETESAESPFEQIPNASDRLPRTQLEEIQPDSRNDSEFADDRAHENSPFGNGLKNRFKLRPPLQSTSNKKLRPYIPDSEALQLSMSQR